MEVGNTLRILDILILLYDYLPDREALIRKYTDVVIRFNNAYITASHGRQETGANLVWKCHALILAGILRREQNQIDLANELLKTLLEYKSTLSYPGIGTFYDDGFHVDGSFIQHYFFGYTGAYGKHLISILSQLLYAFDGSGAITLSDEHKSFVYKTVFDSYEPFIYNGRFMNLVRGREPSQGYDQDNIAGLNVTRALSLLALVMPSPYRERTQSMLKQWLIYGDNADKVLHDYSNRPAYFAQGSHIAALRAVMDKSVVPRGALRLNKSFGIMSKTVHLTRSFGLSISMYSPHIACYEYINGESRKFWHMSDGVTYFYTADSDQYNGDFYATVDMQRLPGTTVDRSPDRQDDPYFTMYLPESKNVYAYAGGCTLEGVYGAAGMRYRGQGIGKTRDLEVKKSWFMFDDEVVCLGSGITSTTGDPIETIIDNKRLSKDCGNMVSINRQPAVSCSDFLENQQTLDVESLHISGEGGDASGMGYYFPTKQTVNIVCEKRKGNWCEIGDCINYDEQKENYFVPIWIDHGKKPQNADYAYVVLPAKSAEETFTYAENPQIEVIENSGYAHAAKNKALDIVGVNFWNDDKYICAGITASTQCSVMARTVAGKYEVAISDAAAQDKVIDVSFPVDAISVSFCDDNIKIVCLRPLTIEFNSANTHRMTRCLSVLLA
jgi:hyaluronate lyase